jgi:hypothetical protein
MKTERKSFQSLFQKDAKQRSHALTSVFENDTFFTAQGTAVPGVIQRNRSAV